MILYLDTSSVVKLYLDEPHADSVRRWALHAEVLATSRVAYPEAVAALARRSREGDLAPDALRRGLQALKRQWKDFAVVDLTDIRAGDLAVKHALRGLDAVEAPYSKLQGIFEVQGGKGARFPFCSHVG